MLFSLTHPVSLLAAWRMCAQGMLKLVNPPTTLDRLRGAKPHGPRQMVVRLRFRCPIFWPPTLLIHTPQEAGKGCMV